MTRLAGGCAFVVVLCGVAAGEEPAVPTALARKIYLHRGMTDATFEDVIDHLRRRHHVRVDVDEEALDRLHKGGVAGRPVEVRSPVVPLGVLLEMVANQVDGTL